jgi:DNA-binding NarL/FixJ family response regulator
LLTQRELEVARAVGQGKTNADIAGELHMSMATVKARARHPPAVKARRS